MKVFNLMTQLTAPMMPEHNPMKKKVVAIFTAVVVGHMGIMWALSHMKTLEIKNNEKPPMSVRFVQIKPEPIEPIKPVVEPIPKPKPKVEPKVEPKIIAQKAKPVEQKIIQKEEVKEKKKVEPDLTKQRELEQEKLLEQQRVQREQQLQRERADQQRREAEQREAERRAQQELDTPKKLSIGQISWSRSPRPVYTNSDLQGSNRIIVVSIEADVKGNITSVRVVKSSGIPALDQKIVRAVNSAKFKPYKENGIAYPFKAEQPFELTLNSNG